MILHHVGSSCCGYGGRCERNPTKLLVSRNDYVLEKGLYGEKTGSTVVCGIQDAFNDDCDITDIDFIDLNSEGIEIDIPVCLLELAIAGRVSHASSLVEFIW